MRTILIPDRLKPPADVEQEVFGSDYKVIVGQAKQIEDIPLNQWKECVAILAWHDLNFSKDIIEQLGNCKTIVRVGVGYDNVDLKAAGERGIVVCTVPDYGVDDVADHSMGLLLSLSRGLDSVDSQARNGTWEWTYASNLKRLTDSKLGIIGLGRIGTAVALRAKAFGIKVFFYDPYIPRGWEKSLGVRRCETLLDLAEISDIISIHVPLTHETQGMINNDFFNHCDCKPIIVNTARGGIVDLNALYAGLKSDKIQAAGLDVLEKEPPNDENPLIRAWKDSNEWLAGRLIITPHCAFCNVESLIEMRQKASQEALRVLNGDMPRSCVNKEFLMGFQK